jgi:hypothetical protein
VIDRAAAIDRAAVWGTGVFVVTNVLAALVKQTEIVALVLDLSLFVAGTGLFLWALVVAAGRSREHEMTMAGIFFLLQSAPRDVQRRLLGAFGVQIAVAFAVAILHPSTSLAFSLLVPVYGLALAGQWGARYGTFPPRKPTPPRRKR